MSSLGQPAAHTVRSHVTIILCPTGQLKTDCATLSNVNGSQFASTSVDGGASNAAGIGKCMVACDENVDCWAIQVDSDQDSCSMCTGDNVLDDDGSRISSESAARRKFTLRFPRWSANLSNSAKDLLYNLLDVDPKNRFTAEQALAHPWVKGQTVQPNNYLQSPSLLGKSRKDQRAKEAVALALSPKTSQMNSRLTQIKEESRAMNPRGNNGGQRSQNMTRADSM